MSFSLAIADGDLVGSGSGGPSTNFAIVYGVDKLIQDLTLWLNEGYGGDIMHPELGSVLEYWIGGIISPSTHANVQAEVLRVLQNYQSVQLAGMKNNPSKYSLSEVLYSVNDIQVTLNYDEVAVTISVSTAPPQSQIATIVATARTQ